MIMLFIAIAALGDFAISANDFCEILYVTNPTVIEMVKRGEIREKKIGGRILYDAAEIDEAVKENKIFRYKRRKNDRF